MPRDCRARIVATLGPASSDTATIAALYDAGADVFRLNFSHGTQATIRESKRRRGRPIGILADLQGPKIRIGQVPGGPRDLATGERVRFALEPTGGAVPLPHREVSAPSRPASCCSSTTASCTSSSRKPPTAPPPPASRPAGGSSTARASASSAPSSRSRR